MSRTQKLMVTIALMAGLAGCEGETTGTDPRDGNRAASTTAASESPGCDAVTAELLNDGMRSFQGVLNIAATRGENLADLEQFVGAPDPEAYRSLAAALGALNFSGVDASMFGTAEEIAAGLEQLADLLEDALAQRDDPDHEAWTALETFSQENLIRLQAGANHYFAEAGCLD